MTNTASDTGRIAFVFGGQGSQWPGMAADLYDSSPVFRQRLDECAQALDPHIDWPLIDTLRGAAGTPSLDRVDVVQPALFAMMIALAELWRVAGITPDAVIGHSQGEIAAAVVAGGLSLDDGARIVALRSRAIATLGSTGAMAAIPLSHDRVEHDITTSELNISIAAINGPTATVIAGDAHDIHQLVDNYLTADIPARIIPVDYASHSPAVETLRENLLELLAPITPQTAPIAFHSTVTTTALDTATLDADYWYRNLRNPVRMQETTTTLLTTGHTTFIEVSPHPILIQSIEATAETTNDTILTLPTLRRDHGNHHQLLTSLANADTHGLPINWNTLHNTTHTQHTPLPTYPFQHQKYWL
ncbi:acyltransferase domain-containing protein, partial [Nocardia amikacinitolerans]|uniref:acyltransferase domain-containing protein n=1 Tax=Nocardia amikacinitolerans TaxID=756689 RepID=UPI001471875E